MRPSNRGRTAEADEWGREQSSTSQGGLGSTNICAKVHETRPEERQARPQLEQESSNHRQNNLATNVTRIAANTHVPVLPASRPEKESEVTHCQCSRMSRKSALTCASFTPVPCSEDVAKVGRSRDNPPP